MRSLSALFFIASLLTLAAVAVRDAPPPPAGPRLPPVSPKRVLVVFNAAAPGGREIARYYADKRKVPDENLVGIVAPAADEWAVAEYRSVLEAAVKRRAGADPALDYVVLTRGVPFRFSDYGADGGYSIDSVLSTCLMEPRPGPRAPNPYNRKDERFSRAANGGMVLVTRLDGPTEEDARRLVDSSLNAKPVKGPFFLRDSFAMSMKEARGILASRGFTVEWVEGFNNEKSPKYQGSGGPFLGHWGAGPHDTQFSAAEYEAMRFLPGALCDLTWSASAAGLRDIKSNANIAVMTRNGAAGAQGYVSEPYADTVSRPEVVLERYTRGYNLAESFAAGELWVNWKQIVLGDPLCAPYAQKK